MPTRLAALAIIAGLVSAACGAAAQIPGPSSLASSSACQTAPDPGTPAGWAPLSTAPAVIPILINPGGELACGENRVLFSFLDASNIPLSGPDMTAKISLFDLARDPTKAVASADGSFIWAIEGSRGIYAASVAFPEAGIWGAEFVTSKAGASSQTVRLTFQVEPSTPVIRVGQQAPASKTPTGDPKLISTDQQPNPAFYTTSVDQALAKHEPFVLIFATPKFCVSRQCGPTLDRIKPFASKFPSVTFINVEPYVLKDDGGQLQPVLTGGNLTTTDASNQWGLLAEPWTFVVDRTGRVRASFELIFSDVELTAALDAVK